MDKRKWISIAILLVSLLTVAACSVSVSTGPGPGPAQQPAATELPPISAPQPAAAPSLTPASNAPNTVTGAIQNLILKANHEQEQAVASRNPSIMSDTSTSAYYKQAAQNLNDLLSSGVTAIKLVNLSWGAITLQNKTTVQATTVETWTTSLSDGSTVQESDTNVYTVVQQNRTWKIQQDDHPNSRTLQPPSGNPGGATTPPAPVAPLPPAGPGQSQSRNWSGYAATGGSFTAVSGTWTIPNVDAGTTGIDATWVGIGGVSARDLIQAGTQAIVQSGQVSYSAWVETLPQASEPVPITVNPGDSVTVSISQQSNGKWQIAIKDATNAQTYQTSLSYRSSHSSAEWIEEAPATGHRVILPLDRFGRVTFSGATTVENGQQRTAAQAGAQPIAMYTTGQQQLAQPSTLSTNGSSFTVTRTDVAAPILGPGGRRLSGNRNSP